MATYIEYQLEDGTIILVETDERQAGGTIQKASRDKVGNVIASVNQKFENAFAGVKKSAVVLRKQLEEMRADEVEVTFNLKATGEAGNFAIGRIGAEANYTVKLKWSNKPKPE
jgi:TusA-related sulfurtransferase